MKLQKTFGAAVGMEPLVQTRLALTDFVECSDGTMMHYGDVLEDCRGGYHKNEIDRHEADVEIVREILTAICKSADEYCTENKDYASGDIHIVDEVSHEWPARIKEWDKNDYPDEVIDRVCEKLNGGFDCEVEHDRNEYSRYIGPGCCLYSLDIGEHEEQIDVKAWPALKELHEDGRLDDVLDALDKDFCINRSRRRVRNEETGRFEEVGRKTYDHGNDYPAFEVYTLPGGQWHYVVPAERMRELVCEAIIDLCRRNGK